MPPAVLAALVQGRVGRAPRSAMFAPADGAVFYRAAHRRPAAAVDGRRAAASLRRADRPTGRPSRRRRQSAAPTRRQCRFGVRASRCRCQGQCRSRRILCRRRRSLEHASVCACVCVCVLQLRDSQDELLQEDGRGPQLQRCSAGRYGAFRGDHGEWNTRFFCWRCHTVWAASIGSITDGIVVFCCQSWASMSI